MLGRWMFAEILATDERGLMVSPALFTQSLSPSSKNILTTLKGFFFSFFFSEPSTNHLLPFFQVRPCCPASKTKSGSLQIRPGTQVGGHKIGFSPRLVLKSAVTAESLPLVKSFVWTLGRTMADGRLLPGGGESLPTQRACRNHWRPITVLNCTASHWVCDSRLLLAAWQRAKLSRQIVITD